MRAGTWPLVGYLAGGLVVWGVAMQAQSTERGEPTLATVARELRELRQAVEALARTSSQTQALGLYVTVTQTELMDIRARLETARREVDAAALRSTQIATALDGIEAGRLRVQDASRRQQLDDAARTLVAEQSTVFDREQQARRSLDDLSAEFERTETEWRRALKRLREVGTVP